jgi:hypothetical protein
MRLVTVTYFVRLCRGDPDNVLLYCAFPMNLGTEPAMFVVPPCSRQVIDVGTPSGSCVYTALVECMAKG